MNLYGFVGNDGVSLFDNLGLIEIDLNLFPKDGGHQTVDDRNIVFGLGCYELEIGKDEHRG